MRGDRADPRRAPAGARHAPTACATPTRRDSLADVYVKAMACADAPRVAERHRGLLAAQPPARAMRVLKLWTQTIVAPVLSSFLFIVVFGLSLGERITADRRRPLRGLHRARPADDGDDPGRLRQQLGVGLPGALRPLPQRRAGRADAPVGGQPRRCRSAASCARCCIGALLLAATCAGRRRAGARAARARRWRSALALTLFASFGVDRRRSTPRRWDHTAFVHNIVILPLTFLGGVFYSVDSLPSPWQEISHLNPIFYLAQRGPLRLPRARPTSSVALSLAVTAALAAADRSRGAHGCSAPGAG